MHLMTDEIQNERLLAESKAQMLQNVTEIESSRSSPRNNKTLAVHMSNGFKSYGKVPVLKDLNLHVPEGAIYGLLGASGSGKTTILKCVVGRISLDTGGMVVFGKQPGSRGHQIPGRLVGYMPQEIALYREFSIDETLTFFGFLHGMKSADVAKRRNFLIDFLDLPEKSRLVKNLSGGQQRRVSLSVALLQDPKLLILDEPTVGVDPLLREKIWKHLIEISKTSKTTIILTTHYIEEARKADYVGLLRYGRILAEQSPESLTEIHKKPTLESVFLKLCCQDHENNSQIKARHSAKSGAIVETSKQSAQLSTQPKPERKPSRFLTRSKSYVSKLSRVPKLNNVCGLIYKDFMYLRRNMGFLIFEFLIPIIQMSLFCLCIGHEPYNLNIGIVNNETIFNSTGNSSWFFINALNHSSYNKMYMNWSEAYKKTRDTELVGFIDLSVNFTSDTVDHLVYSEPNKSYPGSRVNVYLDASSYHIAYKVRLNALEAYQTFLRSFLSPFVDPTLLASPIIKQQPIYGEPNPQLISFMAPGIMVTIVFIITIGLTGLVFVTEKREGLLDRGHAAGVLPIELILGHMTSHVLFMTIQVSLLIPITRFLFGVKIDGPVILAAVLLILQGICGMNYGLAISSFARNEFEVISLLISSVFPSMVLSGIIWPLEGMPHWMRMIANFSPLTHSAEAMRSIASRGWNLLYYPVWFGFATVIGWSLFFDLIALVVYSATEG